MGQAKAKNSVKSVRTKSRASVAPATKDAEVEDGTESSIEEAAITRNKAKRVANIDITESIVDVVEEKPVDEVLESEDEEDELEDDLALDEEAVNPFGDKWEI